MSGGLIDYAFIYWREKTSVHPQIERRGFLIPLHSDLARSADPAPIAWNHAFEELRGVKGLELRRSDSQLVIDFDVSSPGPILRELMRAESSRTESHIQRMNDERVALIQQLSELDHPVVVPHHEGWHSEELIARVERFAQVQKADLFYPRRIVSGRSVSLPPNANWWGRQIYRKVGRDWFPAYNKNGNAFRTGDGGLFREISPSVHIASVLLKGNPQVETLEAKGLRHFFVGKGNFYRPHLSNLLGFPVFMKHPHPDLFVGAVGRVLLADHDFLAENQWPLTQAAALAGKEIIAVPVEEQRLHPACFLVLGPNECLVECRATKTIRLLKEKGVKAIPTAVQMVEHAIGGGGPDCTANEI